MTLKHELQKAGREKRHQKTADGPMGAFVLTYFFHTRLKQGERSPVKKRFTTGASTEYAASIVLKWGGRANDRDRSSQRHGQSVGKSGARMVPLRREDIGMSLETNLKGVH